MLPPILSSYLTVLALVQPLMLIGAPLLSPNANQTMWNHQSSPSTDAISCTGYPSDLYLPPYRASPMLLFNACFTPMAFGMGME